MRGASALQGVLEQFTGPLTVQVIWEPVLPTDLIPPTSDTLGRLKDGRARQYWDPEHLVSTSLREGMAAHPGAIPIARQRTGRETQGILWDAVALFPPGARWEETMPAPEYLDGNVMFVVDELARRLKALQ